MANPDFRSEAGGDQNGTASATISFTGLTWQANDIICIFVATDGYVPTLSTANGFVIAQDPNGNSASVTTNAGTPGTAECGMFVFWKRAVGSTTAQDPEPVIAAPTNSGTTWCLETNSYLGARTTGTPWHIITTGIVSTATATVAPPAVTPTLNAVLVMPCAASANDDQAFNAWTLSGAASPTGQIDAGWHSGSGSQCGFTTGRGGYATTGGSRSGSTTFGASTKQAQFTMVMASLNEAFAGDEDPGRAPIPPPMLRSSGARQFIDARQSVDDELEPTIGEDDGGTSGLLLSLAPVRYAAASDDEVSVAAGGVVSDDDGALMGVVPAVVRVPVVPPLDDEISTAVGASAIDEDNAPILGVPIVGMAAQLLPVLLSSDEAPAAPGGSAADEDDSLVVAVPMATVPPLPVLISDDELSPLGFIVDDDVPIVALTPVAPSAPAVRLPDDEFPGGSLTPGVDPDDNPRPALAPQRPAVIASPIPAEEIAVAVTSGIGGAADAHRSFLAPPQTGTLTTPAPQPSWATSHAYVIDPSQGGQNRVLNGGNLYQCTQDGTSASSGGGPTGTGTAITDGTTRWRFIGAAQGQNTAAGSQVLCTVMRGNEGQAATVQPTDNDGGGTYTVITDNEYAAFAGSFAGVWRRPTASNAKTNFVASGVWGGSGGAGDEMSIGWIEIQGVQVGAPHAFSHVERSASSGGSVTAASITTTVPCIIVSYWFGNGTVQTAGQPDAATPAGGLTLIAGSSMFISLTTSGYIQHMVAWRKAATPGTFAEVWTASPTDEGAQLVTIAYQDLSAPTGISVDDEVPARPRVVAWAAPVRNPISDDEISPPADADADNDSPRVVTPWVAAVIAAPVESDDEVAGQAVVEDDGVTVLSMPVYAPRLPVTPADIDEVPPLVLEEWGAVMALPVLAAAVMVVVASDDETVGIAPTVEDDGLLVTVPVAVVPPLVPAMSVDELATAGGASMVEEDATVTTVPVVVRPWLVVPPSLDEVASASGASVLDDEQQARLGVAPVAPVVLPTWSDDEVTTALAVDEDQAAASGVLAGALPVTQRAADDDAFVAQVFDDDGPVGSASPQPLPAVLWVAADDDLPLAALLDEAGQLIALTWSPPPVVGQSPPSDDETPPGDVAAAIVDEDQLLAPIVWQVPAPMWGPVQGDELPKPKKAKGAVKGTSLLDGPIAKIVAGALISAKIVKPATLIKVTPGVRTPGAASAGVNSTKKSYACKGIEQNLTALQLAGTLIEGVDAAIRIFGATIAGGQVPVAGDQISIAGKTYTIVAGGVSRDPASVSYLCQCEL